MNLNFKKYDTQNMLDIIKKFDSQIIESFNIFNKNINIDKNIKNIIFCGMGGSSIGSAFVENIIRNQIKIPMFINNDYSLPNWVSQETLVIISSYSGNTEEVISNYEIAYKQNTQICIISSGGYLIDQAKINKISYCMLPAGYPPRTAFGFLSSVVLLILNSINLVSNSTIEKLNSIPKMLVTYRNLYINKTNSKALKLAEDMFEKKIIIYSTPLTKSIGYRFKCQLSENSKILSYYHYLPELNHNDIEGYLNLNNSFDEYSIIWLFDSDDDERILKSMKRSSNALSFVKSQKFISFEDNYFIERQYHMLYFLDIVSFFLSYFYKTNPTPVEIIKKIKL